MSDLNLAHPDLIKLVAYQSGRLGGEEAAAVAAHLASCAACRSAMESKDADTIPPSRLAPEPTLVNLPSDSPPTEPMPESAASEIPTALVGHSRYRILQLLGSGGMGSVYKAEHRLMERTVALKVINRSFIHNQGSIERFRQEVKAAARLSHPNIVTAFDAEQAGDMHFLVMEYVEGMSLAEAIEKRGRLPILHACDYVRQVALGLQHAFEKGMVHRDIKPQNLMLSPTGRVKILDFGLARFASEAGTSNKLTATGVFMGTPDYIAPEQALDACQADIRADIYSLGCTLYELLTGQTPFNEGSAIEKVMAHVDRAPKPLIELRHDVPAELNWVLMKMLAKEPVQRYQTPAEVAKALAPFCSREGTRNKEMKGRATGDLQQLSDRQPQQLASNRELASPPGAKAAAQWRLDSEPTKSSSRKQAVTLWSLGTGVVALLVCGALMAHRASTDVGKLLMKTDVPGIELIVRQNGKQVATLSPSDAPEVRLKSGTYDLEISGTAEGLRLSKNQVTLSRGAEEYVSVTRNEVVSRPALTPDTSSANPVKPPAPSTSASAVSIAPGLVHTFAHPDEVFSVAFLPNGRRFVSGCRDQFLRLWDIETGKELARMGGRVGPVEAVAISPDGHRALTGSGAPDQIVRLWDLDQHKELHCCRGHNAAITSVVFSSDGKQALSCGAWPDITMRLWDLRDGKELRRFEGHKRVVEGGAFLPDGRRVVSASWDASIRVWDAENGLELRRFVQPGTAVRSLALSPDGRRFLTGNADKTVRLWDIAQRKEIQCLNGHSERLTTVAFAPDGLRALSGAQDKTVRLWDLEAGRELAHFDGHVQPVRSVSFSADGSRALSASSDKTVRLWQLPQPATPAKPVTVTKAWDGMGQLVIDTYDPGILLNIKHRGKVIASRTDSRLMDLQPGNYHVELAEPNENLRLSRNNITIPWGGQQTISVGPPLLSWPSGLLQSGKIPAPDLSRAKTVLHDDFHNSRSGMLRQKFPAAEMGYDSAKILHSAPGRK